MTVRLLPVLPVLMLALLFGCARQYVAKPDVAKANNDIDWTIQSEPEEPDEETTP